MLARAVVSRLELLRLLPSPLDCTDAPGAGSLRGEVWPAGVLRGKGSDPGKVWPAPGAGVLRGKVWPEL